MDGGIEIIDHVEPIPIIDDPLFNVVEGGMKNKKNKKKKTKTKNPRGDVVDILVDKENEIDPGMEAATKDLYREHHYDPWGDWSPDDIDLDLEEDDVNRKYALIVRREKDPSKKSSLVVHSITVQSPLLKTVLEEAFEGYRGISTKLKNLTFDQPFHEFFYRWIMFRNLVDNCEDEPTKQHLDLLDKVISVEVRPHIETTADLLKNDLINYEYLWAIFEPDTVVYTQIGNEDRFFHLMDTQYTRSPGGFTFLLTCKYVETDGKHFGYCIATLEIDEFQGVVPISELPVVPAHMLPNYDELRDRLVTRGKKFRDFLGQHYKAYTGFSIRGSGFYGGNKQYLNNERIVIDPGLFGVHNSHLAPRLKPLDKDYQLSSESDDDDEPYSDVDDDSDTSSYRGMFHTQRRMMKRGRHNYTKAGSKLGATSEQNMNGADKENALSEDQLVLATPTVRGYCLTQKEWVRFYIDNIHDISFSKEAFEQLVLPYDYKEIILAFVESQISQTDQFDDIIQGKGKGIIMLLSGEPGVGKTLTAESVAEEMKRPLYSMSAGELGHTAEAVEVALRDVLEISTKWGAILLLDECDVFLEQRTISDIERNKLVSVFLRLLEYYQGVMFLTTNRISAFDAAFQSRIHLTINYPKLNLASKRHIWRTFVRPAAKPQSQQDEPANDTSQSPSRRYSANISDHSLDELAQLDLNGREIKNIVKTARLLASRKKTALEVEHIHTVLRVKNGAPGMEVDKERTLEVDRPGGK